MGVGDHGLRAQLRSVGQRHTDRAAALDEDAPDPSPGTDVAAVLARIGRDGLGDRSCATTHEGPLRHLAVDLSDVVVQQHVGRSRRVRSTIGADRAGHTTSRLYLRGLEPLVEELGDGQRHHLDEVAGALYVEPFEFPGEARQLE